MTVIDQAAGWLPLMEGRLATIDRDLTEIPSDRVLNRSAFFQISNDESKAQRQETDQHHRGDDPTLETLASTKYTSKHAVTFPLHCRGPMEKSQGRQTLPVPLASTASSSRAVKYPMPSLKIFLLSPADTKGVRARQMCSPK